MTHPQIPATHQLRSLGKGHLFCSATGISISTWFFFCIIIHNIYIHIHTYVQDYVYIYMYVEICVRLFFSLYFIEIVSRCILVFVHLVPIVSTELRVYLSLFACFRSYFLSCVCVFFGRLPHIPLKVCYLMEVSEGIHGKQYFCVSALQDFF